MTSANYTLHVNYQSVNVAKKLTFELNVRQNWIDNSPGNHSRNRTHLISKEDFNTSASVIVKSINH